MIQMQDVWKTYPNGVMAVNGISIYIKKGEFVYVVGPSGAGKSTFIKMIYREEKPTRGEITIDNQELSKMKERHIPYLRRNIGVVFQDFKLLQSLTVYENVAFAMEVIEEDKETIRQRVMNVLDIVRLKNKARFMPDELSGGEQQRVSIARAIVNNPAVLIADEPTGNLDPETSWEIMHILEEINERGTTIVMATHNRDIVDNMRKRLIAIEGGRIARDELRGTYRYEG
ncbi:cell division ATP-binding protein FtsE [Salipaludibacillus agaradhaerens]|jgi:cell division transport system ATP-binding protein|uniref:Cell division ATP-binding protein FtsE n=1 Tax=Salipaludibacillus agaradhaerens TaxID=76935 RepID=A0A9Q4AY53_SALAG|nr:cell division ATP-binding protein FtsE [Salipaludibacillus agaradhaerens]UJW59042.1 cell division ATP-binding protein FtsE [Bacillus sp. A116_S68]MCR6095121.1 cell division ATP-binding protein FtsE [Salipaludibacillus agaradhaerens]MCR6107966.1 cell division ATP-binding protein FtsE [Salipaludibacillus agaradhaerens]MCR6115321.1 cell division ATP-binding protein FtsE [Salipaludibacillus agaradhaerens]MCR6119992.1 cell division ATP-binding protein FtsE [Salipaludibacillus agaradhaerens]